MGGGVFYSKHMLSTGLMSSNLNPISPGLFGGVALSSYEYFERQHVFRLLTAVFAAANKYSGEEIGRHYACD